MNAAETTAAAAITAAGYTYEPVYTYTANGNTYAFSYESAPNTYGHPAAEVVVYADGHVTLNNREV